jgi:predicted transcriptional regulator
MKTKHSKLELYLEILSSLEKLRCSNIITLQEEIEVEQAFLEHALAFLEKHDLIQKDKIENRTVYSITLRGERITKYFTHKALTRTEDEFNLA